MTSSTHGRWALMCAALAALLLGCWPMGSAAAGGFSVSPVRLFFGERDRALALRLSNEGDEPVQLTADLQAWRQDAHGQDVLEPSEDLVVSPPVMRLAARSEQVVRLILAVPRDRDRQMSYRLFLRERIPATPPTSENIARVPIALALSLPVFITPDGFRHGLQCEADEDDAHRPVAHCRNEGRAHARIGRLDLHSTGQLQARYEGSVYLLPGTRRTIGMVDAQAAGVSTGMAVGGGAGSTSAGRTLRAVLDRDETLQWPVAARSIGLAAAEPEAPR